MKKIIILSTLVSIFLFSVTANANVVYHNNFNYGCGDFNLMGNNDFGGISIVPSEQLYSLRVSTGMADKTLQRNTIAVNKYMTGDIFTMEFDWKVTQYDTENASVMFCVSANKKEYYALSLTKGSIVSFHTMGTSPSIMLCKNCTDTKFGESEIYKPQQNELANGSIYMNYSLFRHFKIAYNSGDIKVYIDNNKEPIISIQDDNPLSGGYIGLSADGISPTDSYIDIDNILIYENENDSYDIPKDNTAMFMDKSNGAIINGEWKLFKNDSYDLRCIRNDFGCTMIPARFISEVLGTEYSENESEIVLMKNGQSLIYKNNAFSDLTNDQYSVIDGEKYIPLRATAEFFGKNVNWDNSGLIMISDTYTEFYNLSEYCKVFGKLN